MALKIGFMTTLGHNVGDEFIREGIRAALDAAGTPYSPLYVDKHDAASLHQPAEDEVVTVRDKYWDSDLFIQSGAPVYWHFSTPRGDATSITAEWHPWMWVERILGDETGPDAPRHPVFANLGAGSGQLWGQDNTRFLADAACVDFARRAGERARLTTVRDPLAADLLAALGVEHRSLPCPAYLAAARHRLDAMPSAGHIGINLMPTGGHIDIDAGFDPAHWETDCSQLVGTLRQMAPVVFVAHDTIERDWMQRFAGPGERVFLASTWRPYLDVYAGCALVVANRVHGAVCAAGFGVPGIILGNDSRAQIGCAFDLPVLHSGHTEPREVATVATRLLAHRKSLRGELRSRRDAALQTYRDLLEPVVEQARARQQPH